MRSVKSVLLASAGFALASLAIPANAQGQAPAAAPATSATTQDAAKQDAPEQDDGRIADIVVTAQRRTETLQRVPIAATVVSGDSFAKTGNYTVEDLEKLSPSLTFDTTTSARNNSVRIRGIGTNSPSSGIEPETSTVLDGVVLIRAGQSSSAQLLDLDRIEVLRGPQGTLFGKNASAGVLNIVTKNPTDKLEGSAALLITNDQEYSGQATLSVPLTDSVGVRLGGSYHNFKGNVLNVFNGDTLNGSEGFTLHGKLKFEPTDDFMALITVDYGNQKSSCCARPIRELDLAGSTAAGVERPFLLPVVPGFQNQRVNNDVRSRDDNKSFVSSLLLEKGFGEFKVTAISAYQSFKINQTLDDDLTSIAPIAGGQAFKQTLLAQEVDHGYSQEVRLTSPKWDHFDFVVGAYALGADTNFGVTTLQRRTAVPQDRASDFISRTEFTNYAAFGQGNIHITPALTVLIGGRYTYDKVTNTYSRRDDPVSPFRNGNLTYAREQSARDFAFKGGVQYEFTPDIFTYFTYAQGYKGPGFNISTNGSATDPLVQREDAESFEGGAKIRLFDRRVGLNLAVFSATYDNFAISAIDVATTTTQLINAAQLKTKGFELDYDIRPFRGFVLSGGVAYVDATFGVPQIPCYSLQTAAQGCLVVSPTGAPVVRGQRIVNGEVPNSPDWKFNINADYTIKSSHLPFNLDLGASYAWTGAQQFLLNQDPEGRISPYGLIELTATARSKDDKLSATLFIKNLTDKFYVNTIADAQNLAGSKVQFIPRDVGRYFGVRLAANF